MRPFDYATKAQPFYVFVPDKITDFHHEIAVVVEASIAQRYVLQPAFIPISHASKVRFGLGVRMLEPFHWPVAAGGIGALLAHVAVPFFGVVDVDPFYVVFGHQS
jgi:heat shock protein HspQ